MMKQAAYGRCGGCGRAIRQFYRSTTLHGFKYLCSKYYSDRVVWVACCVASACCAGVLCAVLWARFLQMPALLTVRELRGRHEALRLPTVAVCPAPEIVADAFLAAHDKNENIADKERLSPILGRVLRRKPATRGQLQWLAGVLRADNVSLQQFLFKYTPACQDLVRNCRWQTATLPCFELFRKEITQWGACCVMRPTQVHVRTTVMADLGITRRIHLGMQCSNNSLLNGCEFYTKYENEEWTEPAPLTPGLNHFVQLRFVSVAGGDDALVGRTCSASHSRSHCLLKCKESFCGCADPLHQGAEKQNESKLCSVTQLNCLRSIVENATCNCLPPCRKISTFMAMESSPIRELNYTYDTIYKGINLTNGVTLSIRLRISGSRHFNVSPTETWITLLSSLGGVFNMFLGVGLFSALEVLFLMIIKLPIAIKRHSELELPPITRH